MRWKWLGDWDPLVHSNATSGLEETFETFKRCFLNQPIKALYFILLLDDMATFIRILQQFFLGNYCWSCESRLQIATVLPAPNVIESCKWSTLNWGLAPKTFISTSWTRNLYPLGTEYLKSFLSKKKSSVNWGKFFYLPIKSVFHLWQMNFLTLPLNQPRSTLLRVCVK